MRYNYGCESAGVGKCRYERGLVHPHRHPYSKITGNEFSFTNVDDEGFCHANNALVNSS